MASSKFRYTSISQTVFCATLGFCEKMSRPNVFPLVFMNNLVIYPYSTHSPLTMCVLYKRTSRKGVLNNVLMGNREGEMLLTTQLDTTQTGRQQLKKLYVCLNMTCGSFQYKNKFYLLYFAILLFQAPFGFHLYV